VNRPHLATSLRCTMYDAMWHLCTDAMATLAFSGEVCRHVHVLLSGALSLRSLSLLFPARRSVRLPCSLPVLPSVEASVCVEQCMSLALLTPMTVVDLENSQ